MGNRLSMEPPYLLQRADNPVDWRPWGSEAFEETGRSDKPIFLSIGYSICHWCHVLAHESFEDETVAQAINAAFLPVKVDREERPDVDAVYMAACLAMNGSGGWPPVKPLPPTYGRKRKTSPAHPAGGQRIRVGNPFAGNGRAKMKVKRNPPPCEGGFHLPRQSSPPRKDAAY